ncbi:Mor transcription activator family protein [uncultured Campylobacter sp.]|uniref:Mor transcription activator family protein n=1 Tax=uncultured Campylobacter sp. TaxID=218934 RepID=UPI00204D89DB|nr:Mor transcription activator family protein [uncultured Campylobacter sp.]DAW57525.1 MAG TPA: Middle operon regulator, TRANSCRIPTION.2A [Caudoviricetes sp.]
MIINNFELFVEFYERIKKSANQSEILKDFGGANIYIPSYKATFRNDDIRKEYKEGLKAGKTKTILIRELAAKFDLSYSTISKIIKS